MPETLQLFNTFGHAKQSFSPLQAPSVGLYTCGPTVYNYAHIGNLRTYIFEDVLKRVLRYNGYHIKHVMNITDVGHLTDDADQGEDKMEKGSAREGKSAWEIAEFYTKAFKHDLRELNILEPDIWCKATDHIIEQIELVKKLEQKGFAYRISDGIYFDTSKLPNYGKLTGLRKQALKAGARVGMGEKKHLTDFALWKFSPAGTKRQMEWASPWGMGFPGWHIECSAMAAKYLGQPFDIHCGGIDHIPVHHTNEIAQSEAAAGKALANFWLHGEFLVIPNGDKMAKSGENFITLETVRQRGINPLSYRYLCLQTHYRKPLTFTWEALQGAANALKNLYNKAAGFIPTYPAAELKQHITENKNNELFKTKKEDFLLALNDDLNTPEALAIFWDALKGSPNPGLGTALIHEFDQIFGLNIMKNTHSLLKQDTKLPEQINRLIALRNLARAEKNWAESDRLRGDLQALGYRVADGANGTEVFAQ